MMVSVTASSRLGGCLVYDFAYRNLSHNHPAMEACQQEFNSMDVNMNDPVLKFDIIVDQTREKVLHPYSDCHHHVKDVVHPLC